MMDTFEAYRPSLFTLAYRMLGAVTDAEDVLQEAHLRFAAHIANIEHPKRWLEQVVTRLCLDELKSARARREEYVGAWLPEPLETDGAMLQGTPVDPESISLAFLMLLERLSPPERAAFVLIELFEYSAEEAATVLERQAPAVRQLLHRARSHVQAARPRFAASRDAHLAILGAFFAAVRTGDVKKVESFLAQDARAALDGGGQVKTALNVIHGAERVARLFIGLSRKIDPDVEFEVRHINGWPALVVLDGGVPASVTEVETDGSVVFGVWVCRNPAKLRALSRSGGLPRLSEHG
ncbi:MAG: sigma-70 family RNA polymerase sigma factor [Myxococcales bacterium]|nr:MAG: sigma-70 family RNA polymerase sigma factor [Myxococcales bacterium]